MSVLKPDSCWKACMPQLITGRESGCDLPETQDSIYLLTARRLTGFKKVMPMRWSRVVELETSMLLLTADCNAEA